MPSALSSAFPQPSANVMNASDLQYMLEKLMRDQANNGDVLFLKGEGLPDPGKAGLASQGPGFCLAGTAAVITQVASDGPELYVRFTVPDVLCFQRKQYNASSKQYEVVAGTTTKLESAAMQVVFPAHQALENLMIQPSPLRPVINQ